VAAAAFGLEASRNYEGRDELIVTVPFDQFPQVADLLDRLGDEPEAWPWSAEEAEDNRSRQVAIASQALALPQPMLADNPDLLRALRLRSAPLAADGSEDDCRPRLTVCECHSLHEGRTPLAGSQCAVKRRSGPVCRRPGSAAG
jgi:hypothetical protein